MACPPWFCPCLASHVHNSDLLQGLLPHVIFQYFQYNSLHASNDSEAVPSFKRMRSCALQALRLSAGELRVLKFAQDMLRNVGSFFTRQAQRPQLWVLRDGSLLSRRLNILSCDWLNCIAKVFLFPIYINYITLLFTLFTQMIIDDHRWSACLEL